MKWVKLHVTLRHNRAFRGLSVNAKVAFICGLMAAADYDMNGSLHLRQRALTEAELAEDLMLTPRASRLAILELVNMGFLVKRPDGVLEIDKWAEKCGEESFKETNRLRQQRHRERRHLETLAVAVEDVTSVTPRNVTRHVTVSRDNVTDIEEEVDNPKANALGIAPSKSTWVEPLRAAANGLGDKTIKALSVEERFIIARYHCLVFGNCTKSEVSNRAKASNVASAFASMSRNDTYGELTVRRYFTEGRKVHEQREKKPWFDPWLIKGVLVFENA